jgi:hypothetical protein
MVLSPPYQAMRRLPTVGGAQPWVAVSGMLVVVDWLVTLWTRVAATYRPPT